MDDLSDLNPHQLADEIERRVKALDHAPDARQGGILLPWRERARGELERFLFVRAMDIVKALRSHPGAGGASPEEKGAAE